MSVDSACDRLAVGPGQPEQVLDDAAQPRALPADPLEHLAVVGRVARSVEGQAHLCLDDGDGGPELVRRVRGEFGLSATDQFGRRRGPEADHGCPGEHGDGKDHAEDELGDEQHGLDVGGLGHALTGHEDGAVRLHRVEAEGRRPQRRA